MQIVVSCGLPGHTRLPLNWADRQQPSIRDVCANRAPGEQLDAAPKTWEVRREVQAAVRALHRAGVKHGALWDEHVLVDTSDPVPTAHTSCPSCLSPLRLLLLIL